MTKTKKPTLDDETQVYHNLTLKLRKAFTQFINEIDDTLKEMEEAAQMQTRLSPECEKLIEQVCAHYRVSPQQLMSTRRMDELVIPRHVCIYVLRKRHRLGLRRLGKAFCRTHSAVVCAMRSMESRMKMDKTTRELVDKLMRHEP